MNQSVINDHFGEEQAKGYDDRWRHTAPVRDAIHVLTRAAFLTLPANARILCVGAGTGAEILALSATFPGWHFVAVEPSGPMLARCREKAEAAGIAHRCEFFEGFVESLPPAAPFDGATSILVSQFLIDPQERTQFFREIKKRLLPGGPLVTVDLASGLPDREKEELYQLWLRFQANSAEVSGSIATAPWQGLVAISQPAEVEAIIQRAGFTRVLPIYQALFIHGWLAQ